MAGERGKKYRLSDTYRFPGFAPDEGSIQGMFGDRMARILPLKRRSKKLCVAYAAQRGMVGMTARGSRFETYRAVTRGCILSLTSGEWTVGSVAR
jgi:hypothetical protein